MKLRFWLFFWTTLFTSLRAEAPRVVAANTLLWDLTRQVAGDSFLCVSLVPVGVDPHTFQPSPTDVRTLAAAQVVIVNGLGLDPWVNRLIENSGFRGELVTATDGIKPLALRADGHDHDHGHDHEGEYDPHAWHDLTRVARYVENIRDALCRAAPTQADELRSRANALLLSIQQLDTEARQRLGAIPSANRRLCTSHDSLAYLGDAYGLTILPIAGLRPDREPSARELARLVKQLQREKVRAVFIESTSNPKVPRLLASEAGVSVVTELYTDSLGPEGSPGATFLGMFRHNLDTLTRTLQP